MQALDVTIVIWRGMFLFLLVLLLLLLWSSSWWCSSNTLFFDTFQFLVGTAAGTKWILHTFANQLVPWELSKASRVMSTYWNLWLRGSAQKFLLVTSLMDDLYTRACNLYNYVAYDTIAALITNFPGENRTRLCREFWKMLVTSVYLYFCVVFAKFRLYNQWLESVWLLIFHACGGGPSESVIKLRNYLT